MGAKSVQFKIQLVQLTSDYWAPLISSTISTHTAAA